MELLIAGMDVRLLGPERALAELERLYLEFEARGDAYAKNAANPHLCFAGCSQCCRSGAFFAVTLVEALRLSLAVTALPDALRARVLEDARQLLALQASMPDEPARGDEAGFNRFVAQVARAAPACPMLEADLCSVYAGRPFLCRAYGFPVDAYAVETEASITFRSLCHLHAGSELGEYVQARDLKARLAELSRQLVGGADPVRFTSAEASLARVR